MSADITYLVDLNDRFLIAENDGSTPEAHSFFESVLASSFAMRRANGLVVDRERYVRDLKSGGDRRMGTTCNVQLLGINRALVTCVVTMTVEGQPKHFDNARVFVKEEQNGWKLLAWANEPLASEV